MEHNVYIYHRKLKVWCCVEVIFPCDHSFCVVFLLPSNFTTANDKILVLSIVDKWCEFGSRYANYFNTYKVFFFFVVDTTLFWSFIFLKFYHLILESNIYCWQQKKILTFYYLKFSTSICTIFCADCPKLFLQPLLRPENPKGKKIQNIMRHK